MGSFSTATWPENLSKQLIKKLVRGKESASKLQTLLLHNPSGENGPILAEQLSGEILASLTDSISFVMSFSDDSNNNDNSNKTGSVHGHQLSETVTVNGGQGQDVISQINPHEPLDHHSHCDDRSSGDSGEISKKRPPFKDRRGCYKRRKSSQSWSIVTSTIEDGQAWRKYGQKAILNSEYPRAYFRCTKKHDQGCKATKQVQQTQCNPNLYQTTYIGHHSCKHILKSPQMIVDSQLFDANNNNNMIINFNKPEQVKVEETQISEDQCTSDDGDDLWSDLKDIELSLPDKSIIGPSENDDQGIENSIKFPFFDQTNDSSLITLDDMVESIEFRDIDDFHFDDYNFPIGSA